MSMTISVEVQGMTCSHCVNSVTEELMLLPPVTQVVVDLELGIVTVESDSPLEISDVEQAVEEAGYSLVAHQ
jgi:copper chaperone CopZ